MKVAEPFAPPAVSFASGTTWVDPGRSPATSSLNVGAFGAPPLGPASTRCAVCVPREIVLSTVRSPPPVRGEVVLILREDPRAPDVPPLLLMIAARSMNHLRQTGVKSAVSPFALWTAGTLVLGGGRILLTGTPHQTASRYNEYGGGLLLHDADAMPACRMSHSLPGSA